MYVLFFNVNLVLDYFFPSTDDMAHQQIIGKVLQLFKLR